MENLIKIDDLGVPLFLETPIFYLGQIYHKTLGFLTTLKRVEYSDSHPERRQSETADDQSGLCVL